MDKVVHFEIPFDDGARARDFYASVFDWDVNEVDMGGGATYTTVTTVSVDDQMMPTERGAINGGMMRREGEPSSPVITIQVDAIDGALEKIEAAGGKTVTPRTAIPGMGAFAYFEDTEGNTLGLWETE
ncbi:MAG TPA: VOC family protein [Actinomycetota bacterium]